MSVLVATRPALGKRRAARWLARAGLLAVVSGLTWAPSVVAAQAAPPAPTEVAAPASPDSADRQPLAEPLENIPFPDLSQFEDAVESQLTQVRVLTQAAVERTDVAPAERGESLGSGCRLFHAYKVYDTAAPCYRNASRLAPQDPRWYHLLAVVEQEQGNLDAAVVAYRRELTIFPGNVAARVRLGQALLNLGRPAEAVVEFDTALAGASGSAAAMAGLGQAALAEKRYADAIRWLEAALAAAPVANRLHHPLGLAYRGAGDLDKAREHLEQRGEVGITAADPWVDELPELTTGELSHLLRGRLAFRANRPNEAVIEFRAAVEAAPGSARARVNLGSALAALGEDGAAAEQLREALRLEPDNATAHFNLGFILARRNDLQGAAQQLAEAARLQPEDAGARRELAAVLARGDRHELALVAYREAMRLDPASEDAHLGAAAALVSLERYAEAVQELRASLDLLPSSGRLSFALARLLAASPDPSVRDGQQALELSSAVFEARRSPSDAEVVALALAELGRCEQAAEWHAEALEARRQQGEDPRRLAELEQIEARYQAGPPCRPPIEGNGSTAIDTPSEGP